MEKTFFLSGTLYGFLAVALGAFGSHLLKTKLGPEMLAIFEIGVRYQLAHSLALLAIGWGVTHFHHPFLSWAGWMFVGGILIFSGSLYFLALTGVKSWGAVTPLGGILLLLGWGFAALGVLKS